AGSNNCSDIIVNAVLVLFIAVVIVGGALFTFTEEIIDRLEQRAYKKILKLADKAEAVASKNPRKAEKLLIKTSGLLNTLMHSINYALEYNATCRIMAATKKVKELSKEMAQQGYFGNLSYKQVWQIEETISSLRAKELSFTYKNVIEYKFGVKCKSYILDKIRRQKNSYVPDLFIYAKKNAAGKELQIYISKATYRLFKKEFSQEEFQVVLAVVSLHEYLEKFLGRSHYYATIKHQEFLRQYYPAILEKLMRINAQELLLPDAELIYSLRGDDNQELFKNVMAFGIEGFLNYKFSELRLLLLKLSKKKLEVFPPSRIIERTIQDLEISLHNISDKLKEIKAINGSKGLDKKDYNSGASFNTDAACTADGLPLSEAEKIETQQILQRLYTRELTAGELVFRLGLKGTLREKIIRFIFKYLVRANLITGPPVVLHNGRKVLGSVTILRNQKTIYLAKQVFASPYTLVRTLFHEFGAYCYLWHWLNKILELAGPVFIWQKPKALSFSMFRLKVYFLALVMLLNEIVVPIAGLGICQDNKEASAPFGVAEHGVLIPEPDDLRYQAGKEDYYQGNYEQAALAFEAILNDVTAPSNVRMFARQYLLHARERIQDVPVDIALKSSVPQVKTQEAAPSVPTTPESQAKELIKPAREEKKDPKGENKEAKLNHGYIVGQAKTVPAVKIKKEVKKQSVAVKLEPRKLEKKLAAKEIVKVETKEKPKAQETKGNRGYLAGQPAVENNINSKQAKELELKQTSIEELIKEAEEADRGGNWIIAVNAYDDALTMAKKLNDAGLISKLEEKLKNAYIELELFEQEMQARREESIREGKLYKQKSYIKRLLKQAEEAEKENSWYVAVNAYDDALTMAKKLNDAGLISRLEEKLKNAYIELTLFEEEMQARREENMRKGNSKLFSKAESKQSSKKEKEALPVNIPVENKIEDNQVKNTPADAPKEIVKISETPISQKINTNEENNKLKEPAINLNNKSPPKTKETKGNRGYIVGQPPVENSAEKKQTKQAKKASSVKAKKAPAAKIKKAKKQTAAKVKPQEEVIIKPKAPINYQKLYNRSAKITKKAQILAGKNKFVQARKVEQAVVKQFIAVYYELLRNVKATERYIFLAQQKDNSAEQVKQLQAQLNDLAADKEKLKKEIDNFVLFYVESYNLNLNETVKIQEQLFIAQQQGNSEETKKLQAKLDTLAAQREKLQNEIATFALFYIEPGKPYISSPYFNVLQKGDIDKVEAIKTFIDETLQSGLEGVKKNIENNIAQLGTQDTPEATRAKENWNALGNDLEDRFGKLTAKENYRLGECDTNRLLKAEESLGGKIKSAPKEAGIVSAPLEYLVFVTVDFKSPGASSLFNFASIGDWNLGLGIGGDELNYIKNLIDIGYGFGTGALNGAPPAVIVFAGVSALQDALAFIQRENMRLVARHGASLRVNCSFGIWPIAMVNAGKIKYMPVIEPDKITLLPDKSFVNIRAYWDIFRDFYSTLLRDGKLYKSYLEVINYGDTQKYDQLRTLLDPGIKTYQQRLTKEEYQKLKPELIGYFSDKDKPWLEKNWQYCLFVWEERKGENYLVDLLPIFYPGLEPFIEGTIGAVAQPGMLNAVSGIKDYSTLETMLSGLVPQEPGQGGEAIEINSKTKEVRVYPTYESMVLTVKAGVPELDITNSYHYLTEGGVKKAIADVNPLTGDVRVFGLKRNASHYLKQIGKLGKQTVYYLQDKNGARFYLPEELTQKQIKRFERLNKKGKAKFWREEVCIEQASIHALHGTTPIYSALANQEFWSYGEQPTQNEDIKFGEDIIWNISVDPDPSKRPWLIWDKKPEEMDASNPRESAWLKQYEEFKKSSPGSLLPTLNGWATYIIDSKGRSLLIPGIIDFAKGLDKLTPEEEELCAECDKQRAQTEKAEEKDASAKVEVKADYGDYYEKYLARVGDYSWLVTSYLQSRLYEELFRIRHSIDVKTEEVAVNDSTKIYLNWIDMQNDEYLQGAQKAYDKRLAAALANRAEFKRLAELYGQPQYNDGGLVWLYGINETASGIKSWGKMAEEEIAMLESMNPGLDVCLDLQRGKSQKAAFEVIKDPSLSFAEIHAVLEADAREGYEYSKAKLDLAENTHLPTLLANLSTLNGPATQIGSVLWYRANYLIALKQRFVTVDWGDGVKYRMSDREARIRYDGAVAQQKELKATKPKLEAYTAGLKKDFSTAAEYLDWFTKNVFNTVKSMYRTQSSHQELKELNSEKGKILMAIKKDQSRLYTQARELAKLGKEVNKVLPYHYAFSEDDLIDMIHSRVPSGSSGNLLFDTILGSEITSRDVFQIGRVNFDISNTAVEIPGGAKSKYVTLASRFNLGERVMVFLDAKYITRYQYQMLDQNKGRDYLEHNIALSPNIVMDTKDGRTQLVCLWYLPIWSDKENKIQSQDIQLHHDFNDKVFVDLEAGMLSSSAAENSEIVSYDDEGNKFMKPVRISTGGQLYNQKITLGRRFGKFTLTALAEHLQDTNRYSEIDDILGGFGLVGDMDWLKFGIEVKQGKTSEAKGYAEANLKHMRAKVGLEEKQRFNQQGMFASILFPWSDNQGLELDWKASFLKGEVSNWFGLRHPLFYKLNKEAMKKVKADRGIKIKTYYSYKGIDDESLKPSLDISGTLPRKQFFAETVTISHKGAEDEGRSYTYDSGIGLSVITYAKEYKKSEEIIEILQDLWRENKGKGLFNAYNIFS
ncbi:MAG: hypothetical protein M0R66_08090, partial [Candidatus Omnitrophica bacterium]|nr:hypothetical protein [Candidatus Omnitrophota bacterium]